VHGTNFVLPPLRRAAGVLTVHDLSYLRYPETVAAASLRYRTLVPRGLRRAAVVVTPSQAVAAEVKAEYGLGDRVLATPLGVDEGWFGATPMPAAELAARGLPERYLLFVGTVEPRKGLPALLSALRLLHDSDRVAVPPLVLAGPPGWGPALETAALPPGAVLSAGYLDTADLRRLVAGAALLAYPSVYEGFGRRWPTRATPAPGGTGPGDSPGPPARPAPPRPTGWPWPDDRPGGRLTNAR